MHNKDTNISLRTYTRIVNLTKCKRIEDSTISTVFIQTLIVYYDFLDLILSSIMKKILKIEESKRKEMKVKSNSPKHIQAS